MSGKATSKDKSAKQTEAKVADADPPTPLRQPNGPAEVLGDVFSSYIRKTIQVCRMPRKLHASFTAKILLIFWMIILEQVILEKTCMGDEIDSKIRLTNFAFSPDNSVLKFNHCRRQKCFIGLYHFKDKSLKFYKPPEDQYWFSGKYSPDGKKMAIVVAKKLPIGVGIENMYRQIAVMNTDGTDLMILTDSPYFKTDPSFSRDGKKIIYIRSNTTRLSDSGKQLIGHNDIYEVSISAPIEEKQLTNYRFWHALSPAYLDDKTIIYNAEYPDPQDLSVAGPELSTVSGSNEFERRQDFIDKYIKKYKNNTIYKHVIGENNVLAPWLVGPGVTNDVGASWNGGTIFYSSSLKGGDEFKRSLFILKNEKHERVSARLGDIVDTAISPDGTLAAFTMDRSRAGGGRLFVINLQTRQESEISIPEPSGFVNEQRSVP